MLDEVRGKLIVSCQALEDEPLFGAEIMRRMALAAKEGGAAAIRAQSAADIREIKRTTGLPIIGLVKRNYEDSDIYITPTAREIDELLDAPCEMIALDMTARKRPQGEDAARLVARVHEAGRLVLADISTFDEGVAAEKFGADALRFALVYLTTDSQDVRLSLDFECPYCGAVIEQTKKNRTQHVVECQKCKKSFSTQWADTPEEKALPLGPVVGERFEVARNFCNKLWNASRFVMINLEGFQPRPIDVNELYVEDRWILSRLTSVSKRVTESLEQYKFSDAARALYDFAWDEFCSFYVEISKARLFDPERRGLVQNVLINVLDALLRLLHPITPFVTEEVWRRLADFAPVRGMKELCAATESIAVAPWPTVEETWIDPNIEAQFAQFQEALRCVRDARARQNVPPRTDVNFAIKCSAEIAELLRPMSEYFKSMACSIATEFGPNVVPRTQQPLRWKSTSTSPT